MKFAFLHLSDIHIRKNEHIDSFKIDKLIESISVVQQFDEVIVVCTGDVAFSGNEYEYNNAKVLFSMICGKIRDKFSHIKYIKILVVPGNHDLDFSKNKRTLEEINNHYSQNSIEEIVDPEILLLENFYKLAAPNSCFEKRKICDRYFIKKGDYTIQANLINTALFSTLEPNDKELHFFPLECLSSLRKDKSANLVITIMHHSTEWFNSKCKQPLEKMICDNSSILFLGHDHHRSTKELNVDNQSSIFISSGGVFSNINILDQSEFNIIVLDTLSRNINAYSFNWDAGAQIYTHKHLFANKHLAEKGGGLQPCNSYIEYLKKDTKNQISQDFRQYFVFPKLTYRRRNKNTDNLEINNMSDFILALKEKKLVNIAGDENYGKTTLLKNIFLETASKYIPIYFDVDDIKGLSIDKTIKHVFEVQYSENPLDYEKFQQEGRNRKIAIVDDFDMIKNELTKTHLIELLQEHFEYIIIGTKKSYNIDIVCSVKEEIEPENSFYEFNINNFYSKKRQELITLVCSSTKKMSDEEIENISRIINDSVHHEIQLFDLNPDFIIHYIQYYLQATTTKGEKNEKIFGKVFETNIYNQIINNSKENKVDDIIAALEEIAYFIHFNKKDPLTISELEIVLNEYNEKFSENISAEEVVAVACKAKILNYVDGTLSLRFNNKNHLAFFVAKCLNKNFNINGSLSDIEYILKNICFGINDNIVLFISYIASNPNIIMKIYTYADELMKDWEELDFDNYNIRFLSKGPVEQSVSEPESDDQQKMNDHKNKSEENVKESEIIECKNLYDYDELEIGKDKYKFLRAIRYTEMLSKALPNFSTILIKENKEKIAECIYRYPNKILFRFLKLIDDNYYKIVSEIKTFADSIDAIDKSGLPIQNADIEMMLNEQTLRIILDVYNNFAFLATDSKSINILNKIISANSNHRMFNLLIAENYGATEEFSKKADSIFDNTKDSNIKFMVRLVVRNHVLQNKNIKFNKRQHLCAKYLTKDNKKHSPTYN